MNSDAIVAGLIGGLLSPLVLAWLQHHFVWRAQKLIELKTSIFQDSIRALSLWAVDAMDPALQADKRPFGGLVRDVNFRPETGELMERTRGLVQAFFSPQTFALYNAALTERISHDNIPNNEFERKRTAAIRAMAREINLIPDGAESTALK
jgi:hypothetical protein